MTQGKILIIDDEEDMLDSCRRILEHHGYDCETASSGVQGIECAARFRPDVVITDLRMPDVDGLDVLQECRRIDPQMVVVILTAFATVQNAVDAMKLGATDYLQKPFTAKQLQTIIERHIRSHTTVSGSSTHTKASRQHLMLGESQQIKNILSDIERFAQSNANVLITGESGTGKELVARQIHRLSPRSHRSIVPVDCACLSEELFESELFGHVKGAFTSAISNKVGLLEQAHESTLFFDEISHLSMRGQAKLLRVLQERQFRPVGGKKLIDIDIRVLSASNRNLENDVRDHVFREDLFFRLNVLSIHLPPLRERKEDIPILIDHFIQEHRSKSSPIEVSPEALHAFMEYNWPGNIRELENTIQHCLAIEENGHIDTTHLPESIRYPKASFVIHDEINLPSDMKTFERKRILQALRKHHGERIKAANQLGISRKSLWQKMKQFNITDREINDISSNDQ